MIFRKALVLLNYYSDEGADYLKSVFWRFAVQTVIFTLVSILPILTILSLTFFSDEITNIGFLWSSSDRSDMSLFLILLGIPISLLILNIGVLYSSVLKVNNRPGNLASNFFWLATGYFGLFPCLAFFHPFV